MIVFAEIAIQRDIAQNIVHPAHVPFKIKAEAAHICRLRDERPGGAFLCNHQRGRMLLKDNFV